MPLPSRGMPGWAFWLAVAGGVLVVGGPVLHRVGALGLGPALLAVPLGVLLSLAALLVTGLVFVRGRPTPAGRAPTLAAAALAAMTGLVPLVLAVPGFAAPPIHDITTDTDDPPQFDAVVTLRAEAANSLDYPAETAVAQRAGYPDLATVTMRGDPASLVERARAVATGLGWEVVATDPAGGLLEASDTTFWFGFIDDVVVRIRPAAGGSKVDVRSVSRVGGGDLGANAARIRRFLERMQADQP